MNWILSFPLHILLLTIEYLIPGYRSFLALARNDKEEIRMNLQYWTVLMVVELIIAPIEPIFERILFNADLLKIPFFIWFSNPATMGYRMFYDLLQSKVISPYSERIEEMLSKVSMEVNKYVNLISDRVQRKQVEKKE